MKTYGMELILDLHDCNPSRFTRDYITIFMDRLCTKIDMQKEDLYFWDYEGEEEEYEKAPPHLKGTSAIQFIKTSNITMHTLDVMKRVYLNIFSCKEFDTGEATKFSAEYFQGTVVNTSVVERI